MKYLLILLAVALTGCSSTQLTSNNTQSTTSPLVYSDTMEIIRAAAAAAPEKIEGEYTLKIKATGSQRRILFLNTENDYRDQRNVSIALSPSVISDLSKQYGLDLERFFVNKTLKVKGEAQRVKIYFMRAPGVPSTKYYYQTHIPITSISQLQII